MQMLILLGSPRKNGNSERLARNVAQGFEETGGTVEYVLLNNLNIRPCQGCGGCDKTGVCVIDDDMAGVYRQVDEADRLLVASPIYFYNLSAQTKIFADRMQARWSRKYNLKEPFRPDEDRRGYLLSTAATKGARLFECCELTLRYTFDALDIEMGESFLVKGVDKRKDVLEHQEALEGALEFGRRIGRGEI